jgi:hypothetical protein
VTRRSKKHSIVPPTGGPTATATATVANGAVTGLTVTNPGSGYTSRPTISFSGGGGVGASARATVTDGTVTALTILEGGLQYTSPPTVAISLDEGAAFLSYSLLPSPDPLQVPQSNSDFSQLIMTVSNSPAQTVSCSAIQVTLPGPSNNAEDLTNSFAGIGVEVPEDGNGNPLWTMVSSGGEFTLTPKSPAAGTIAGAGISFIFDNILVNSSVGACQIQIAETASTNSTPAGTRQAPSIEIDKWPPRFAISGPTATPTEVNFDGSALIDWVVTGQGVTTTLIYNPDGKRKVTLPVANVGPLTVDHLTNPSGVTFTVEATITPPGSTKALTFQNQIRVGVIPTPTIAFSVAGNPVVPGAPVTFNLTWSLVNVSVFQITANDGPGGSTYVLPVPFSSSGTFTATPKALAVKYVLQVLSTSSDLSRKDI